MAIRLGLLGVDLRSRRETGLHSVSNRHDTSLGLHPAASQELLRFRREFVSLESPAPLGDIYCGD